MEREDNEINPQDSVMEKEDQEINWMEEEEAAGSAAQPSNGRLLVKLRLPKMPEEEETAEAKEVKSSHYCKECNKSFNSGKALGGHMSSAHVQANKEYSYRKQLNPKTKSGGANPCPLCEKAFPSKKSLFGHMRCHPNRRYRGMEPPPPPPPESEGFGLKNQDADTDSGSGSGSGSGSSDMVYSFQDWPSTSKKGRGYVRAPAWGPDDRETFAAGHQLLRLIDESNKKQIKTTPQTALRIQEGDEIKGKGEVALDEEEELYITAIQVLMDVKRGGDIKEEKTSIPKDKMGECGGAGSKSSSPEAYMCNLCERGFSTHQALGGHRASHKKFKLTIVNTADRDQKPKETNGEKVVLGFDLNMMPEDEDEDQDEHHCI